MNSLLKLLKGLTWLMIAWHISLLPASCLLAADNTDHYSSLLTVFKEAVKSCPNRQFSLLNQYADQLSFASQPHLAIPLYEEVLASDPNPEEKKNALIGLARAYIWREDYEQALATNRKILEIDPHYNQYDFFLNLARNAASHKKPDIAVEYYQKAIGINPDSKNTLLREWRRWEGCRENSGV